ncbi:UxaA family hydrolase [Desulfoscipio gibsoniae]|uniref:Altronate dehydratase n=1 Tax=Desulfoscipio gibsoniae DSM 7213 TaxID=767817 RepID=R4KDB8_9FIRM|nr:UxaA family hydrolase [Desulfoscipio gibsoniae]AGK99696.1 altronate dehydratase [Desulfoscipio gibsoniae DSM 7213]
MNFLGYIRPDGNIGVRNKILIISTDFKTDRICINVAGIILNAVPVVSGPTMGQLYGDYLVTMIKNPNTAGAVVLGSGSCDIVEKLVKIMAEIGKPVVVINISESGGIIDSTTKACREAMLLVREVSTFRRQSVFLSRLILGLVYEENEKNSKMEDLLYYFIEHVIKNNGRIITAKRVTNKQNKINNYPVVKKLEAGDNIVDKQGGLYEINYSGNQYKDLLNFASKGAQLVISLSDRSHPAAHSLVPIVNITADKELYNYLQDEIEMNLSELDYQKYDIKDYSLLILNEVIASASGKLTKGEIFKI